MGAYNLIYTWRLIFAIMNMMTKPFHKDIMIIIILKLVMIMGGLRRRRILSRGGDYSRHFVRGRDILCVFPEQDLSFGGAMFNLIIIITIAFQMCKINGLVIR